MNVVSWNAHSINDTTNYVSFLYSGAYGLPRVNTKSVSRQGRWPLIASVERPERVMFLEIIIRDIANLKAQQVELQQWFDPDDETPKKLVVEDAGGSNDRYVYAVCEELQAAANDENNYTFVATLKVHGDVRWREVTASSLPTPEPPGVYGWEITATGQTKVIANSGQDVAYPVIEITPTDGKTGGYSYKRYVPVRWMLSRGWTRYPLDICNDAFDTAALTTAKMRADGNDLRVFANGVEIDRWLDGIDTTTTKVWVNLNFVAKQEFSLKTAIAGSGDITTIDVYESVNDAPDSGVLMIGSEAFTFTEKNNGLKQFGGVTRAAKGTSEAAHSALDVVWWNQNDIFIYYGDASAASPDTNDHYEPIFNKATSTNTSWDYDSFGTGLGDTSLNPGSWAFTLLANTISKYTADHGTDDTNWAEIGMKTTSSFGASSARWSMHNPCGITAANFQNGEKYRTSSLWFAAIVSAPESGTWVTESSIAMPTAVTTWENWSQNETLASGAKYVGLYQVSPIINDYVEVADVTLTIDSTYIPVATLGAEQGNYSLDCVLSNSTTGEGIEIHMQMALDQTLEIDCANKTITYQADGSNQLQAMTFKGNPRRDWFNLAVGNNTWLFADVGTNGVGIDVTWEERHYQ